MPCGMNWNRTAELGGNILPTCELGKPGSTLMAFLFYRQIVIYKIMVSLGEKFLLSVTSNV